MGKYVALEHFKNILLTGPPGIGKTTAIRKVVGEYCNTPLRRMKIGGFYTQEIREGRERKGFLIKTLEGQEGILAHMDHPSRYTVGRYGVNLEGLEKVAVPAIYKAIEEGKIIVVDELGRMELYSPEFQKAVIKALDSPNLFLGVIQIRRNPFLDGIREREDVRIIPITHKNRDSVPDEILSTLLSFMT